MIRIPRAALALLLLAAAGGATAADTAPTARYRGDLTMACGTKVVGLDLEIGGDGAITGTATCQGTAMNVTGRLADAGGKRECRLEITPGLKVGASTALQTSFVFAGVKVANTGKKDAPKRLRGNEKRGPLALDVVGG